MEQKFISDNEPIFEFQVSIAGTLFDRITPARLSVSVVVSVIDTTSKLTTCLEYRDQSEVIPSETKFTLFSEAVYDFLDLALCLKHLANTPDTTIQVLDPNSDGKYYFRAQTSIYEWFFDVGMLLCAKDNKLGSGVRLLYLLFKSTESSYFGTILIPRAIMVTPDEILKFAEKLEWIHYKLFELSLQADVED